MSGDGVSNGRERERKRREEGRERNKREKGKRW